MNIKFYKVPLFKCVKYSLRGSSLRLTIQQLSVKYCHTRHSTNKFKVRQMIIIGQTRQRIYLKGVVITEIINQKIKFTLIKTSENKRQTCNGIMTLQLHVNFKSCLKVWFKHPSHHSKKCLEFLIFYHYLYKNI